MVEFTGKDILSTHKKLLETFWATYGSPKAKKLPSPLSKNQVLAGLIEMGEFILNYRSTHDRKNFDKRKNQKQFTGFELCFACKAPAQVRHHIIWISHGGRNQKNNIVGLCRDCHAEIHPWLKNPPESYELTKNYHLIFNRTPEGAPNYVTIKHDPEKVHISVKDVPSLIAHLGVFLDTRDLDQ